MSRLRVHNVSISLDGFAAGPHQSVDDPMGVGAMALHHWAIATPTFQRTHPGMATDAAPGSELDDEMIAAGIDGIGATIMGRNMFGPVRGDWGDASWTGWWGEEPPFHHPVFVLTHHPRPPLELVGTTFHFVTDGIAAALAQARAAAGGLDVRLGGGPSTIDAYLRAGLVDTVHVAIAPVLLGDGVRLFDRLDHAREGYRVADVRCSPAVVHVTLSRV